MFSIELFGLDFIRSFWKREKGDEGGFARK